MRWLSVGLRGAFIAALAFVAGLSVAAPDEDALGKAAGYPRGSPHDITAENRKIGSFSALDEIMPSKPVARGTDVWQLKAGPAVPEIRYTFEGQTRTLEDYLQRQRVTSLLIVKNGELLFERYQYDRSADQRFISFSMAKSITSLLVGIALEQGSIKSIDDTAETYAPELKGSAYGAATIRNLLLMGSGVRWQEDYGGRDDVADLWGALFRVHRGGNPTSVLTTRRPQDAPAGARFKYATGETQVLCHVLHGATKRSVSELTSDWLWKPMGAQAAASWLVGWQGIEYCGGGFNATARDYARLGMLLARDGERDGRQVIPKAYLLQATDSALLPPGFRVNEAGPGFGYGYQ
ncbi:MAG: serine hydrolase domain-containing protein, partial [Brachymonas sp.]